MRLALAGAAALHASSWALQSATVVPESFPELTALEQALFWIEHDRWRAAPSPTNVFPLTVNGRVPDEETTGGAAPPRVPVKVWTLAGKSQCLLKRCQTRDLLPAEAAVAVPVDETAATAAEGVSLATAPAVKLKNLVKS